MVTGIFLGFAPTVSLSFQASIGSIPDFFQKQGSGCAGVEQTSPGPSDFPPLVSGVSTLSLGGSWLPTPLGSFIASFYQA